MEAFLFFSLGFGYVCLFIWGLILSRNHGLFTLANMLLLVIIGLVYDNSIIALGRFIGEGITLENLSYVRFWIHALFTPTLILFAWNICFRSNFLWSKKNLWKVLAYIITIGLIINEFFTSVKGLKLEPNWQNGVLTYESISQSTSPFMVIFITLVLGIVGILFIVKFHFLWLFFGAFIMTLGSILANWIKYFPIMNILEFIFIVTLLLTKQFLEGIEKKLCK